jgi:hypothetical protein
MVALPINIKKFAALKLYSDNHSMKSGIITENTYDISKYKTKKFIDLAIKNGTLTIDYKNLEKLSKYLL